MFRISSFALLTTLVGAAPTWPGIAQARAGYLGGAHASGELGGLREAPPAAGLMPGARLSPPVRLLAGVFEGNPAPGGVGFGTMLEAGRGGFAVTALELHTREPEASRPNGRHTLGVWYHSADTHLELDARGRAPGNQGAFISFDQRLYSGSEGGGGLHLFARSAGTRAGVAECSDYLGKGAAYHGLGQRQDDTVGAGVSTVWLGAHDGARAETAFELFYQARFTRLFSLHPDLQLFRDPRGQPGHGWASTARLRLKV